MKFWQQLLAKLQENKNVYLLTVIQNSGSSPGRKGFKMLVAEDDFIFGSVGGGVMEFALVEEAKHLLSNQQEQIIYKKQIHKGSGKDGSGMICSGEQTVVFHPLNTNHITLVSKIVNCLKNSQQKTIHFSPTGISFNKNNIQEKYQATIHSETNWLFQEQIGFKETIYIVGGGHVGLAVSKLFRQLNFYVVVFDNRENLNTFNKNTFAHQKHVIDYNEIENHIIQGNNSYITIMTNKYTDDKLVLSKLIKNSYKYIGVLGSKAKLKTMWNVLLREGITQQELELVFAPIGIPIKSETPEEIAVSIAAEIIRTKNSLSN
ncbi:MAG: XdhC family protein [Flavobacteriaceae bacterium]|nr:XdhC family protein [Flavobacteriaceae bacterium]